MLTSDGMKTWAKRQNAIAESDCQGKKTKKRKRKKTMFKQNTETSWIEKKKNRAAKQAKVLIVKNIPLITFATWRLCTYWLLRCWRRTIEVKKEKKEKAMTKETVKIELVTRKSIRIKLSMIDRRTATKLSNQKYRDTQVGLIRWIRSVRVPCNDWFGFGLTSIDLRWNLKMNAGTAKAGKLMSG